MGTLSPLPALGCSDEGQVFNALVHQVVSPHATNGMVIHQNLGHVYLTPRIEEI
jgi:hypothetical protein